MTKGNIETTKFQSTTLTISVHRKGANPVYGEGVTKVSIEDFGTGAYISLEQDGAEIHLDLDELEAIYTNAGWMLEQYDLSLKT